MARKRKTFRGGEGRIVKAVLNRYEISRPAEGDRQISDDTCEQVYFFVPLSSYAFAGSQANFAGWSTLSFGLCWIAMDLLLSYRILISTERMQICSHQQDQEGADEWDQCRCLWCPGTSGLPKMLDVGWSVGMQRTNGS